MVKLLQRDGGRFATVLVCDICGDMISSDREGAAVFRDDARPNEKFDVLHVHKGKCLDLAEERLGNRAGWQELGAHIYWLASSLEIDREAFARLHKLYKDGVG